MRSLILIVVLFGVEQVSAALPLTDGAGGMTCSFHIAGARATWMKRGGDWSDAENIPYGNEAISTIRITPNSGRQTIELDVSTLANEWMAGALPTGAIFLRPLAGREGVVAFSSREHPDISARPVLIVEWIGGERSEFHPTADTTINCTTIKSLGASATVSVGGNASAVFVFPFNGDKKRGIRSARVVLTSEKQWGRGADVGVYRLQPPWVSVTDSQSGLAAQYVNDRAISSDPDVFFASGFDERNWREGWSTYGRSSVIEVVSEDVRNRFVPHQDRALRVSLIPKQNLGLDLRYDFAKIDGFEPEEAYMRYYLRFGDNWNPMREGGKLPGFAGTYNRGGWGMRKADGKNGWSARGAFFSNGAYQDEMKGFTAIGSYVYHMDIENASSVNIGWGLGPTGRLRKNQWYSVEQYVKLNVPGKKNGILRAWIDGQLVFERTDLRFRDISEIRIENAWFNVYHGGVEKPPYQMDLYIDNIVIAKKYIGPMAGAKR